MTMTATESVPSTVNSVPMGLADSCDSCGFKTRDDLGYMDSGMMIQGSASAARVSQAYVRVTFADGTDLLFCGHHYAVNELALATVDGITIDDQRPGINKTAGYSA